MPRQPRTIDEKKKYGPIWNFCDIAYCWTYDRLPNVLKRNLTERRIAFSLGFISGYGAAEIGANVAYPLVAQTAEAININIPTLETIATHALVGTASIPVGARLLAPGKFKEWKEIHPRYSAGVFGVMVGASARALQELIF